MAFESKFIERKFGKKQSFKVPEGYFDELSLRMAERIPSMQEVDLNECAKTKSSRHPILRYVIAVAACTLAAFFSVYVYMNNVGAKDEKQKQAWVQTELRSAQSYSAVDVAEDYAMVDNEDIYAYLADN